MKSEELRSSNFDLGSILFTLKNALDLYKILSLNIASIKQNGIGKSFFDCVHELAINSYVVNICKIFEEKKNYELYSIPEILRFIQSNSILPRDLSPVENFITSNKQTFMKDEIIDTLFKILKELEEQYNHEFNDIKGFRDKWLVHPECRFVHPSSLASYDVMERLLNFGIDFYTMICNAYTSDGPADLKNNSKVLNSASSVLSKLGIDNVKTEFQEL